MLVKLSGKWVTIQLCLLSQFSRHFTITYCVKRNLPKKIVKLQLDRTYLLSCKNSVAILFKYIVVITDFQQFYRYCQHGKNVKKSYLTFFNSETFQNSAGASANTGSASGGQVEEAEDEESSSSSSSTLTGVRFLTL